MQFVVGFKAQDAEPAGAVLSLLRWIRRKRIAALDDPHREHAMKHRPVVRAFIHACDEVRDVGGRRVRQQVQDDRARGGLEHGLLVL